ncbi:MAG: peptide-methionine (S)-S-oxide reductase MsrA [Bdellovibrionales bacterium]|nr:peptide-methionine (S)-S-oxide reductase MsrA [Bdellovibrionales bacterium]
MREEVAILAGGCFWCLQPVFDKLPGVTSTRVGFSGGDLESPSYEAVCSGGTGHREVVEVRFDPQRLEYGEVLEAFFRSIDPTQSDGQFADKGDHYKTAVFVFSEQQASVARDVIEKLNNSGKFNGPIVTEVKPAMQFYAAEEYHQRYYEKNAGHYEMYAEGSGRKPFLRSLWGEK